MQRRDFITLLGGTAATWPMAVRAQAPRVYRVGYLGTGTSNPSILQFFRDGLRELGWVEGQNIIIEYRYAQGRSDALPGLANELIGLKVDVIVASPTPASLAAKNATQTLPIVGIGFDNPVQHGLIASLARPGGNFTGISYAVGPEIFGKALGLLKELVPGLRTVAVLSNPDGPNHGIIVGNLETAAQSLGIEPLLVDVRRPEEFDVAFETIAARQAESVFVVGDPMYGIHQARLTELSLRYRLPAMHTNRVHVEAGGLMGYGPSFPDLWRRAAAYVDKILKGAKPTDLPVEQPTKFELVINLKTARSLGLEVPATLLARADEVIE
jgi:putative tryptophan/tyrosine transport system substrate-binding protein